MNLEALITVSVAYCTRELCSDVGLFLLGKKIRIYVFGNKDM